MPKEIARANGESLWFKVQIRVNDGIRPVWMDVPGWYSRAEARSIRAVIRRTGYSASVVKCERVF